MTNENTDEISATMPGTLPPEPASDLSEALRPLSPLEIAIPSGTATPDLLHTGFLHWAARKPTATAVIAPDRTLTYEVLEAESRRIAGAVSAAQGQDAENPVAIVMERGWEQVVAVLGVVRAGVPYVPLEPGLPPARLGQLIDHASVGLVITQESLRDSTEWPEGIRREVLSSLAEAGFSPLSSPRSEALAYIIYTSGSTGAPKGVALEHRAAMTTVNEINRRYGCSDADVTYAISSLSFDLSVYDIFGLLAVGGAVVVPAHEGRRDPEEWVDAIARYGVTIWNSVPALAEMAADSALRTSIQLDSLRLIMLSGDWIPLNLIAKLRKIAPRAEIVSLGGATEAGIWSIAFPIDRIDRDWRSIPYGRALAGQEVRVLDEEFQEVSGDTIGEICIAGGALARGYWRDEVRTAASFPSLPSSGGRVYRTGDLGRYLPDGNIEILGRKDFQVKVRGFRIELTEIEHVLAAHPAVDVCIATVEEDVEKRQRLVAYVLGATTVTSDELRAAAAAALPEHMVPNAYFAVEALPLTENGKVDRRALSTAVGLRALPRSGERATPRISDDPVERAVVSVWCDVLALDDVSPAERFFEIGGTSALLKVVQVALERDFGIGVRTVALFEHATPRALSAYIRARFPDTDLVAGRL